LKIFGDRRALSPIFASLIILAIVTVLFIPVFIWSTGVTVETQSFWDLSGLIATESIVIEEVWLRAGEQSCSIYVRNIGKTAIIVDDIFISSDDGSHYTYEKPADFSTDFNSVVQGDLMTITIPDLGFTPLNVTYTVNVFTKRGVGNAYQILAT
jgi:flagellin-like protein